MREKDENLEKKIDEILAYYGNISKVEPPESFVKNVMARFDEEVNKGRKVTMNYMMYMRVAAALIVFAVVGNLLILISSLKQTENNEMIMAFSSEYNIDQQDQWWNAVASGEYYDFADSAGE